MTIVVGDRIKNKLTQDLFKIPKIENERVVMLENEKRRNGSVFYVLPVELDDHFDRVSCLNHQLKPKACFGQRKTMGDHLTKWQALTSYQFNGSRDVQGTSAIRR